ncbi:nuclear nucleic acid-binding protein C1D [Onthophagus taurus]|uniref:nuclear nucleic acid-binding protein C1D n=1 Tax=Onthophagus taurus TaxID=166361 RepID=UPI0039BE1829
MDFEDLKDDPVIQEKLNNFHLSVNDLEELINKTLNDFNVEDLSIKDKINYDLFVAYLLNTCYWMYLRTKGLETEEVKLELGRIKEYMLKAKQAVERKTIRPLLNKPVAERFVKHGINYSKKNTVEGSKKRKRN